MKGRLKYEPLAGDGKGICQGTSQAGIKTEIENEIFEERRRRKMNPAEGEISLEGGKIESLTFRG